MNKTILSYDYEIKEKVYQGKHSIIYRAIRIPGNHPVIIKTVTNNSSMGAERLAGEFQFGSRCVHNNIIKYIGYIPYKNRMSIVMEDFGAGSLKEAIPETGFNLNDFLTIAIQLVKGINAIHRNGIIHRDINPGNILIDAKNNKIKIIDFSISSTPGPDIEQLNNPKSVEGTLSYISPEQTGRVAHLVDHRTDIYSLGVTFYEILSGRLPFKNEDPFDIIHSHIALNPPPLHKIKPEIPVTISEIISKLMNKNPLERYKSCYGIKNDLEKCLREYNRSSKINSFQIGEKDISIELQIPQKLYGREEETEKLYDLYKCACEGSSELLMIKGDAGIGKSALVNDLQNHVLNHKGNFISGKFDESDKNIAYIGIISAMKQFIKKILGGTKEEIDVWKIKLLKALGDNGRIIIDIIKELEFIIGPQPAVPDINPLESKKRFEIVFLRFIKVFTASERPLIIFLDDLQWADSASIDLLKLLAEESGISNLFLIGAYRENEIGKNHSLAIALNELKLAGIKINYITLLPLSTAGINALISDALFIPPEESKALAELVEKKTRGNIFFVREFLFDLYRKKMLTIHEKDGWGWDIKKIKKMEVTDNVVKFITEKIKELPEDTRELLNLLSCIGNFFTYKTLSILIDPDKKNLSQIFIKAIKWGILIKTENAYKFAHDRIYEAAYSLVPDEQKKQIHYMIGRTVLNSCIKNGAVEESIFQIVKQLNSGEKQILNEVERTDIAELNLKAGEISMASTAFGQALYYFSSGLNFLSEKNIKEHYRLAFALMLKISECEYLTGNYKSAENKFKELLAFSRHKYDKAEVYNLMITFYTQFQKTGSAVDCLREGLKLFNYNLPFKGKNNRTLVYEEKIKVDKLQGNKNIDDILNLPVMSDPDNLTILNLIVSGSESLFFYDIDIMYLAIIKSISLSFQFGNSKFSSIFYLTYGYLLAAEFNQLSASCQFGDMSFRLDEKLNNSKFNTKLIQLYGVGIIHWQKNIKHSADLLYNGYKDAIESGKYVSAMFNLSNYLAAIQVKGSELNFMYSECRKYLPAFESFNNQYFLNIVKFIIQYTKALKGKTFTPSSLSDRNFDEKSVLNEIKKQKIKTQLYHYYRNREVITYLCGDTISALNAAMEAEKYFRSMCGLITSIDHPFYYSLILSKYYTMADPKKKKKYFNLLLKSNNRLKIWAENNPENFLQKYLLVEAEFSQLTEKYDEAANLYNSAIESAHKNGFKQDEAIANELAANFYLKRKMNSVAENYMAGAHKCYAEWGAVAKVKQLEKNYPELLIEKTTGNNPETKQITGKIPKMDLTSIIRASQSLSGEINLKNLLIKLMNILIKNAGAEKVCLILEKNKKLVVEAEMDINSGGLLILQSIPVDKSGSISQSIVNYVSRTGDDVILDNATTSGNFINDSYIKKNKPKSIICTSIKNKGELMGILYLENNITTGAFTPGRVETLKIISYQAAISIENARLYSRQEKTLEELKNLNKLKDRLMKQYQESNYKNLQKRANPHFLFNAIHTIHGLMITDMGKAENAIIMLGDIYHFIADRSFESLIPLNEEWEFVKNYLEFEEINSPETISIEIKKSGNFSGVNIPPLTIQPLVENSIKHGLRRRDKNEFLKINAMSTNGNIIIEVLDNGIGLETENIFSGTLGNIRDRLKYHYNESDLHVSNTEDGGVRAIISFEQSSGNTL